MRVCLRLFWGDRDRCLATGLSFRCLCFWRMSDVRLVVMLVLLFPERMGMRGLMGHDVLCRGGELGLFNVPCRSNT